MPATFNLRRFVTLGDALAVDCEKGAGSRREILIVGEKRRVQQLCSRRNLSVTGFQAKDNVLRVKPDFRPMRREWVGMSDDLEPLKE